MKTLTLTRRGTVIVKSPRDDTKQCGKRGSRKLFYKVEITCPSTELDRRGFMVDQLDVHTAIQERFSHMSTFVSCERIAMMMAAMVSKMVRNVIRVRATVGMSNIAYMTCELA